MLPPACDRVGRLEVADIGIPTSVIADAGVQLWVSEPADATPAFSAREPDAHKGSFGHVLVIGGAQGKTGAGILAATGALRVNQQWAGFISVLASDDRLSG